MRPSNRNSSPDRFSHRAYSDLVMWIRKSEAEIQNYIDRQEAKKKSLLRPFLFALMLTNIAIIAYSLGYRGGWLRGGIVVVSNGSIPGVGIVFAGLFLFAFFFAFALYRNRRTPAYSASDHLLCRECKQPSSGNPSASCRCGGELEPFAFFSWVEYEKPNEA
jgi:hypothetical protein